MLDLDNIMLKIKQRINDEKTQDIDNIEKLNGLRNTILKSHFEYHYVQFSNIDIENILITNGICYDNKLYIPKYKNFFAFHNIEQSLINHIKNIDVYLFDQFVGYNEPDKNTLLKLSKTTNFVFKNSYINIEEYKNSNSVCGLITKTFLNEFYSYISEKVNYTVYSSYMKLDKEESYMLCFKK